MTEGTEQQESSPSNLSGFIRYKRNVIVLVSGFLLLLLVQWIYKRTYSLYIEDARIATDMISVSSNVSGWITGFPVEEGDVVKKGDLLVLVDNRQSMLKQDELDRRIASKRAEIKLKLAQRDMIAKQTSSLVHAYDAAIASALANADKAKSELSIAKENYKRYSQLLSKKLISFNDWEQRDLTYKRAQQDYHQAKANLSKAEFEYVSAEATTDEVQVQELEVEILKQELSQLEIQRQQHQLDLTDRLVMAPIDGVIDKTFMNVGEYVVPGRRLLMLHNPETIWVNANIKETQLHKVRIGSPATISVDAYPGRKFSAKVAIINNATTTQFALLPNPNPSGNFTKVTQRVTMRLAIKQEQQLLKPGMMVEVMIDTRH